MSSLVPDRRPTSTNMAYYKPIIMAWLGSLRSDNTRRAYQSDFAMFVTLMDRGDVLLLDEIQRKHVDLFARACEARGDSEQTLARRLSAVSSFYRYAIQESLLDVNPVLNIRRPRIDQDTTTTAALSRREAEDLLDAAREHSPRSLALVDLLITTGIRISEALTARSSGLSDDRLVIMRKGKTEAVVYLPEHTVEAIRAMNGSTGRELLRGDEKDPLLFTTQSGRPWDRNDASRLLHRLARRAGISKKMSPHVLRHTHATLALELGVPLQHLQDSLGHRDPRTTRRYDHSRNRFEQGSSRQVGQLFS